MADDPTVIRLDSIPESDRRTARQIVCALCLYRAQYDDVSSSRSRRPGFPLNGQAPGYLAEDCQLVADVSARRLRSADAATCFTCHTSNILGDRCFAVAGPWQWNYWNSLPINLRQRHSLEQFKRLLKTFLFSALRPRRLVTFA